MMSDKEMYRRLYQKAKKRFGSKTAKEFINLLKVGMKGLIIFKDKETEEIVITNAFFDNEGNIIEIYDKDIKLPNEEFQCVGYISGFPIPLRVYKSAYNIDYIEYVREWKKKFLV